MVQNTHKMLSGRRRSFLVIGTAWAALAAGLLSASAAFAQEAPVTLAQAQGTPQPAAASERPQSQVSTFVGSLIPGFQFDGAVNLSETYTTNSYGVAGVNGQDDWITDGGLALSMHDHSRRVSFDANYNGQVYYYARGGQDTQITTNLDALANVIAIPDYLNFIGRAFAQPVVLSNSGFATASGIGSPNGYRNGYGYSAGPDITFRLGDFASSDTLATYGAAYFTQPSGVTNIAPIPGVAGPENTTTRSVMETLKSGQDFSRLQWTIIGSFSELDRQQGLFSEKAGIATLQYAITREFSLLGTGGYDALHNTIPLTRNVSGPVGMGGIAINLEDLQFQFQAGTKYNSLSYEGSLRWNITATSALSGIATDTVTTPEGQLLNNLSNLTASLNGTLTTPSNIYANGTTSSLASFSTQSLGSLSFNQNITRYQQASLSYLLDYERDHASLTAFFLKATELSGTFIGSPTSDSWGMMASYAHNISPLTTGSINAGYTYYQELGGHSKVYNVGGQISYQLGPQTGVYFRTDYYKRDSSQALQSLSPFTGGLDDLRLTVGLSHQL